MSLADLVAKQRTAVTQALAKANPANPAKVAGFEAVIEPRLATLATLALANEKTTEILEPPAADRESSKPDTTTCYCPSYGGHCSSRLPQNEYPKDCLRISCEHYEVDP